MRLERSMLTELVIRDLALIERATLTFGPGLNAITGETGAGKSLLVGALELLLGERRRPNLVRSGASSAQVDARCVLPGGESGERIARWIKNHMGTVAEEWKERGASEERELVLSRTVSADGRTRAHVNGRPLPLRALAELAPRVFEIHGQNDHQRLFEPSEQLRLLDEFGGLGADVARYAEARRAWLALVERVRTLAASERERRERLELLRFQADELATQEPDPDERAALTAEREILRHASELSGLIGGLVQETSQGDDALLARLQKVERLVRGWKDKVAALASAGEELAASALHLADAARALESLADRVEADPVRLEAVEERLYAYERLEQKYGTDARGLVERARTIAAEIAASESDQQSLSDLDGEISTARRALLARGNALRRARKGLRERLVTAVHRTLEQLGLERARFDLRLGQRGEGDEEAAGPLASLAADGELFGERGIDRIEFLLSANPGEPLAKLRQVASGGESARIMLALRSVLASAGVGRTLVFDEIDSGVGGRLGPEVGAHLKRLAAHHQILCVTHLPAIAALADTHLRVSKVVAAGRTRAEVEELAGEARVEEVADMIAGGAAHETARAEARRLILSARD